LSPLLLSIVMFSPLLLHFLLKIITTVFCLAVMGLSASLSPLVCTGRLTRHISSLHLYLCLSSLQSTASFSCSFAVQPLPLVILRHHQLSRCNCLLSAGASPPICLFVPRLVVPKPLVTPPLPLVLSKKPSTSEALLPLVCWRLPSWLPLVCQLVVTLTPPPLVLLMCRLCLWRATSASRCPVASCPLVPLLLFASCLPTGCHVASCRSSA